MITNNRITTVRLLQDIDVLRKVSFFEVYEVAAELNVRPDVYNSWLEGEIPPAEKEPALRRTLLWMQGLLNDTVSLERLMERERLYEKSRRERFGVKRSKRRAKVKRPSWREKMAKTIPLDVLPTEGRMCHVLRRPSWIRDSKGS